ncbi:50S ribosomal protein L11 methyltransferase [Oceanobacillus sp. CAU 1775]
MKWIEISIQTTNEAIESITYILDKHGFSGLVTEDSADLIKSHRSTFGEIYELNPDYYPEEGVRVKSYIQDTRNLSEILEKIQAEINELKSFGIDIGQNQITQNEVDEEDWSTAWKKYYKPVKVSENVTIKPIWETYEPTSPDEIIIELDPGMAFGTGTHPTTMLSIQALEKYMSGNELILDVGCGSGILSIAAAKLGADTVYAYDLDEIAVKSSKANIAENDLSNKIIVQQNNLLNDIHKQADLIVANILAEIIVKFVDDAWENLKNNGIFITSGIIQDKKQLVLDELVKQGFEVIEIKELEDWVSIIARKP